MGFEILLNLSLWAVIKESTDLAAIMGVRARVLVFPASKSAPIINKTILKFDYPEGVAAPLGAYSHSVEVPANAGLIFLSGQVPIRADGHRGTSLAEQADKFTPTS